MFLKFKKYIHNRLHQKKGAVAVEFCVVALFMVLLLMGSVELTRLSWAKQKVNLASGTVGDLITRAQFIDQQTFTNYARASATILEPLDKRLVQTWVWQVIACGSPDGGFRFFTTWTARWYGLALQFDQIQGPWEPYNGPQIPVNLFENNNDIVVVTHVRTWLRPVFSYALADELIDQQGGGNFLLTQNTFNRPRSVDRVVWLDANGNEGISSRDCESMGFATQPL